MLAATPAATPALADPPRPAQASAATAGPAAGAPVVAVRVGEHPGFSRIVFDLPPGLLPETVESGPQRLRLRFPGAAIRLPPGLPARVTVLTVTGDTVLLAWAAPATLRRGAPPGRLVLDLAAPAPPPVASPPVAPSSIAPADAAPRRPEPAATLAGSGPRLPYQRPGASPVPARAAQPPAATAREVAPAADAPLPSAPASLPATPPRQVPAGGTDVAGGPPITQRETAALPDAAPPAAPPAPAPAPVPPQAVLPASPTAGAAAFRDGDTGVVVFDEPVAFNPAGAGDPALRAAEVVPLAEATLLRVPLAATQGLRLAHGPHGWTLAVTTGEPAVRPIAARASLERLDLPADAPGRVVAVPDARTGGLLLVGTLREPAPAGPDAPPASSGVADTRRSPLLTLRATWRGVALAAHADEVVLRRAPTGFAVTVEPRRATSLAGAAPAHPPLDARRLTRLFDLPDLDVAALDRRLRRASAAVAEQPPQARGAARLDAAEAMLALGMGAEAAALVRLARADDPRLMEQPRARALEGAAAVLAGRLGEAGGLDAPAGAAGDADPLAVDEIALWRGLRAAAAAESAGDSSPVAAGLIAPRVALLDAYPAPLRAALLPLAARTLARDGQPEAARLLLAAHPDEARLEEARALLDLADGKPEAARAQFDAIAQGPDRDARARALLAGVDLDLAAGRIDAAHAADALARLALAWRGDARELAARLREAALRGQAGDEAGAIARLREAAAPGLAEAWPDRVGLVRARLRDSLARVLAEDAARPMPPLAFATLLQENADLLPEGPDGEALAGRLADRLAALDLPERAAGVLEGLVAKAPAGALRASLGARLAEARLDQGDPHAALVALSASTAADLPAPLTERRTLAFARATAAGGDTPAALDALASIPGAEADALRGRLLREAGRFAEATKILLARARADVPAGGPVGETQAALLLSLAAAATQAGDAAALGWLRAVDPARLPAGRSADLLRVLTEGPVQGVADLPRAATELALARNALR